MSRSLTVLEQLRLVEQAVAQGEYETANEAARALREAGAESVYVLAIARVP